ncbi:hypothetical protein RI129_010848 [Pyrocoelia pectoralis]|uniref:Multidrug resistance-associated protein lethal(2)03659 n=1 Tax=Pyrocoelia pectoralis TaxID=417401 RepID=A0AAN7ZE10_9COLE
MDLKSKGSKQKNPRENASIFCIPTFLFTLPIFFKGWRKELNKDDVYEILFDHRSCSLGQKLENLWKEEVDKCHKTKTKPSLRNPLIRLFWFESLMTGFVLMVLEVIIRPFQCVLIGRLIAICSTPDDAKEEEIYLYGAGVAFCSLLISSLIHPYLLVTQSFGLKIRVCCSSLVYRKILKLKLNVFQKTNSGKILTLVTNDSNRFYDIPLTIHYTWTGILQVIVITYLLYEEFEMSSLFGVCFMVSFVPIYLLLGKISKKLRSKTVCRTDERVRAMKEIINGIQVLKMYNWERYFSNLVSAYRRMELQSLRFSSYVKGVFASFHLFIQRTAVFITILAFALLRNDISAAKTFKLVCFYAVFRGTITSFLPKGIYLLMESVVPIKRLSEFLLCEEMTGQGEVCPNETENAIILHNVSVRKSGETSDLLSDISFKIKRGHLVAIVGPVGSGKTSLVHVILKELSLSSGSLEISGSCSYAPQEPWIFTSTVRQNIIFSSSIEQKRYEEVLNVCELKHDLGALSQHDLTIVGDRGASLSGGQRARIGLARAIYRKADIYILDDPLSAVDPRVGQSIFDKCIKLFLKGKTVLLITHQIQYLHAVDEVVVLDKGMIAAKGSLSELTSQNVNLMMVLSKTDGDIDNECDVVSLKDEVTNTKHSVQNEDSVLKVEEEHVISGTVSAAVYATYFTIGGHWVGLCCTFVLFVVTQVFASGADYFIAYWVNVEQVRSQSEHETDIGISTNASTYIYSILIFGVIVCTTATVVTLHSLCMRSSNELHNNMFNSLISAPLRFFHINHAGRILNRFSKDIETIDEMLPLHINEIFQYGFGAIGAIILMAIVNYVILFPALIVIFVVHYLRKFYLASSRSLKRVEASTRSPVLGYINATIQGLTTIRAFGAQDIILNEFNCHQDLNTSASYMFITTSRAFGYWTDIICNIFNTCSIFLLLTNNDVFVGNIGLTITQSMSLLGIVQYVIRQYAEMENSMTSVERVLEYTLLEPESRDECVTEAPPHWPERGQILFHNVTLRYSPEDPLVLNRINVVIKSCAKIGVVGRTGAGKSSLIGSLFRLSEFTGCIIIDGIDTKTIPLSDLRSKISIIPQQPTIFSGSIRNNLDPFHEHSDAILWKTLADVELKNLVSGLDSEITEGGINFSVGERQLICLARAMLKNNRILVLDEATANVDPQTDLFIQKTVRKNFSHCTLITVAHRLDTVIDSDKVLVLDDGKVVEFNHPYVLLQDSNGAFNGMVRQLDKTSSEALKAAAQMNYHNLLRDSGS